MTATHQQMQADALRGLCHHDPRSAHYCPPYDSDPATHTPCGCDSCFYGRHRLAVHILTLLENTNDSPSTTRAGTGQDV